MADDDATPLISAVDLVETVKWLHWCCQWNQPGDVEMTMATAGVGGSSSSSSSGLRGSAPGAGGMVRSASGELNASLMNMSVMSAPDPHKPDGEMIYVHC